MLLGLGPPRAVAVVSGPLNWMPPPRGDFPLAGGNWANQRYSALDRINKSTVKRLGGAWTVHLEDGKPAGLAGNMHATPIVSDGVMFISSGPGNVFAIDAATGIVKWKYRSESKVGPLTNRGVVVPAGNVFAHQRDNTHASLHR